MLLDRLPTIVRAPADPPAPAAAAATDPTSTAAAAAAAGVAPPVNGDPFYKPWNLDKDSIEWIDGHKFGDPAAMIKSARHFETVARDKNALAKPVKGKERDWDGWQLLGWEPDLNKYTFDEVKDLPQGMTWDSELDESLRKWAHEERIPLEKARGARKLLIDGNKRIFERVVGDGMKRLDETKASLVKDWGTDYQQNNELALRAMKKLEVTPLEAAQYEAIAGAPGLIKMFHRVATLLGEGKLPEGGGFSQEMTPASARRERQRLEADPAWYKVFNDARNPRHQEHVDQRNRLIAIELKGAHL